MGYDVIYDVITMLPPTPKIRRGPPERVPAVTRISQVMVIINHLASRWSSRGCIVHPILATVRRYGARPRQYTALFFFNFC